MLSLNSGPSSGSHIARMDPQHVKSECAKFKEWCAANSKKVPCKVCRDNDALIIINGTTGNKYFCLGCWSPVHSFCGSTLPGYDELCPARLCTSCHNPPSSKESVPDLPYESATTFHIFSESLDPQNSQAQNSDTSKSTQPSLTESASQLNTPAVSETSTRICANCKARKPQRQFYKNKKTGYVRKKCNKCCNEESKQKRKLTTSPPEDCPEIVDVPPDSSPSAVPAAEALQMDPEYLEFMEAEEYEDIEPGDDDLIEEPKEDSSEPPQGVLDWMKNKTIEEQEKLIASKVLEEHRANRPKNTTAAY
ncbi:hypothetical protein BKA69DRAFT_1106711, partial [Paraphysoderma sedebokerense]